MINVDPNAARRPGLPVPTRRNARLAAPSNAGGAGSEERGREPARAERHARTGADARERAGPDAAVAAASARAGVALQADLPAPRRGLRADAGERARYRAAYESASRRPAPRPTLVRSA